MPKKEKSDALTKMRNCVACDYGHFSEKVPITGECRRNPPRSFLEGRGATPGRFFISVRHDDWCGQFKPSRNSEYVRENISKLAPYISDISKLSEVAAVLCKEKKFKQAIEVYESILAKDHDNSDLAFNIAKCYWEMSLNGTDKDLSAKSMQWHIKASEMGHAEAPFFVGIFYAQGDVVPKDIKEANNYLDVSCEREFPRAQNKKDEGGFK